jgi:hypothetical protein
MRTRLNTSHNRWSDDFSPCRPLWQPEVLKLWNNSPLVKGGGGTTAVAQRQRSLSRRGLSHESGESSLQRLGFRMALTSSLGLPISPDNPRASGTSPFHKGGCEKIENRLFPARSVRRSARSTRCNARSALVFGCGFKTVICQTRPIQSFHSSRGNFSQPHAPVILSQLTFRAGHRGGPLA